MMTDDSGPQAATSGRSAATRPRTAPTTSSTGSGRRPGRSYRAGGPTTASTTSASSRGTPETSGRMPETAALEKRANGVAVGGGKHRRPTLATAGCRCERVQAGDDFVSVPDPAERLCGDRDRMGREDWVNLWVDATR
jgi:hypothetical protein